MEHSKYFKVLKAKYNDKGCTKEQLFRFTKVDNDNYNITVDEFNEIVGGTEETPVNS